MGHFGPAGGSGAPPAPGSTGIPNRLKDNVKRFVSIFIRGNGKPVQTSWMLEMREFHPEAPFSLMISKIRHEKCFIYDEIRYCEVRPMYTSHSPEIRRFKRRGEPFAVYYSPEMAVRAHDHNYILRLISDRIALQAPAQFSLLPQYRSLDMHYN